MIALPLEKIQPAVFKPLLLDVQNASKTCNVNIIHDF